MATAGEQNENPYEGGGGFGTGGKFRKRRRPQTTPYDRPPTVLRNPTHSNGWLSKLVDPAQRLITSSAHRLFASVFRKRLPPPPPPQPPEPEANQEAMDHHRETMDKQKETVNTDPPGTHEGAISGCENPSNYSDRGEITELEQILTQKTFTRSEIDRLTNLLHSKIVDMPLGNEEKRPEVIPFKPVASHDREEFPNSPLRENGIESPLISTPVVNSSVLDEDVASPAELAKAYMGSRPSKVSPSMLSLRSQAFREDSTVLSNRSFPSKSPILSLVPRHSGHVGVLENGFVTPRSRGRSAIYSMARTPYSRVHSTTTLKGAGPTIDAFGGPSSSSQSVWEQNKFSASKQVTLKRRSSVFDNDIGSVGPIRRIRQKPSLLPPKNLSLPASGSPLSVRGTDVGSDVRHPSSSIQKPDVKHSFTKILTENGDNGIPGTSFMPVPSKSSEMASKILQQLDKLVSSKEKSPTKLSPSMLRGPALKSLENVDSSNFLEYLQDNNKLDGAPETTLPDARDSTSQKQDTVEENGPTKFVAPFDKSAPVVNGVGTPGLIDDIRPRMKITNSAVMNSVAHPPPQKKRAFQMSAHEDYLDLDDDDCSNGAASKLAEGREKLDSSVAESETIATEVRPPASSVLDQKPDRGTSNGSVAFEKSGIVTFPVAQFPSMTVPSAVLATQSTLILDKAASPKEPNAASPMFSFGSENVDKASQFMRASSSSVVTESSGLKFSAHSDTKLENSSSFASVAAGVTDSVLKVSESDKTDSKNTLRAGVFFRTPDTALSSAVSMASSTASIFSFSTPANSSSLNNGALASSPSSFYSPIPPLVSSNVTSQSLSNSSTVATSSSATVTTAATSSSSSLSTSAASPSFTDVPILKIVSPVVQSPSLLATSGVESTEANTKGISFGNLTSAPFGGTSSALTSTGGSIFGDSSSAITSTGGSIFGGTSSAITSTGGSIFSGTSSVITSTGSSIFGGSSSASAGTGSNIFGGASSAQTSTGSTIFGGTSSAQTNTGSSIFGFGAAVASTATNPSQGSTPFNSGSAQTSATGIGVVATSTQSVPIQSGSSASSPSFGLAGNTGFSSGSSMFSSTSGANPFSSGTTFGLSSSSTEASTISSSSSTTSSLFGSNWQAPKSPIFVPTFNSTSPSTGFPFGASSASVASTSSAPMAFGSSTSIFSFNSATAAASSQPVFGNSNTGFTLASAPSGNNDQMNMEDSMAEDTVQAATSAVPVFGQPPISPPSSFMFASTGTSGANHFQFGGQQNQLNPQNQSPFQASGSLEFSAGGSFSLGTGGGDKSNRKIVKVKHKQRKK